MAGTIGTPLNELHQDWPSTIRLGVVSLPAAESGAPTSTAVDPFCRCLAGRVGLPIQARTFGDYQALYEAMEDNEVDLAWLPPMIALRLISHGRSIPIAYPVRQGSSWFSSALFGRRGGAVRSIDDLPGKRAVWVDRQSTGGYLVIRAWLRSQGIEPARIFASEQFVGTHQAVVDAVMSGQADVGATYAHAKGPRDRLQQAGWGELPVSVVAVAGPIPADIVAASVALPVAISRAVRDALVGEFDETMRSACGELIDAEAFEPAESEHMAPLLTLLQHLDAPLRGFGTLPPKS